MAKSKQENSGDLYELARDYARAETELGVQRWVFIEFTKDAGDGSRERIFAYNLPREVYERRPWVVRWREAVLVCRFPRANVSRFCSYYDRRLGNDVRLTTTSGDWLPPRPKSPKPGERWRNTWHGIGRTTSFSTRPRTKSSPDSGRSWPVRLPE